MKKKIAVFVSGGGSDMQSVIDAIENGSLNAEISVVIAGKEGIFAIERAKKHGLEVRVFQKKNYAVLDDMYAEIVALLKSLGVEYVVLAGYLTILTPNIVQAYDKKIINIHPSLIPKFCGKGFYGMKVHRAVIEAGEKKSGATVHYVDEGADTGEIIAQAEVEVKDGDTPETLQARVLEAEHVLLPQTLIKLFNE